MTKKKSASSLISELKRKTRKAYSSEDKISRGKSKKEKKQRKLFSIEIMEKIKVEEWERYDL